MGNLFKILMEKLAGVDRSRSPQAWFPPHTEDIELPNERGEVDARLGPPEFRVDGPQGELIKELYRRYQSQLMPMKPMDQMTEQDVNALFENDMRERATGSPEFFPPRPPLK